MSWSHLLDISDIWPGKSDNHGNWSTHHIRSESRADVFIATGGDIGVIGDQQGFITGVT